MSLNIHIIIVGHMIEGPHCFGSMNGENKHYGTPKNPCAPDWVPGGSSSGSAVAVGAKLVDFSLGEFLLWTILCFFPCPQ